MRPIGHTVELLRLDDAFFADPHGWYARMRERRPVVQAVTPTGLPVWLVTRYDDARAALHDPRLRKDSDRFAELVNQHVPDPTRRTPFAEAFSKHMLSSDPPDHTRLRALVDRAFTTRAVAALRPRIEAVAAELVDEMAARAAAGEHPVDLLDAFAIPFSMTVIGQILGGHGDHDQFRRWSNRVLSFAPLAERAKAGLAMSEYLTGLVADRRAHPGADMLSAIVGATEDADRLSDREAVSMVFLLLAAGHETTVNLIGNGMLALLCHPERLAELRADPGLAAGPVARVARRGGTGAPRSC